MVHNTNPNSPSSPSSSSSSSGSEDGVGENNHHHPSSSSTAAAAATGATTSFRQNHHHPSVHHTTGTTMMDEEEDEDEEEDHQDMDYWLQRCSICFDAQLDLCLEYCRDQYCLECFRRYVTEVVTSSWGLSVTKIRCPVCQDPIPQSEWSKFVPGSVVEHYNRYNQPYRSFSRCCPSCETEVTPCDYRDRQHQGGPIKVHTMLKDLIHSHEKTNDTTLEQYQQTIRKLLPIIEKQDWNSTTLPDLYQKIILAVMAFENYQYQQQQQQRHALFTPLSPTTPTSPTTTATTMTTTTTTFMMNHPSAAQQGGFLVAPPSSPQSPTTPTTSHTVMTTTSNFNSSRIGSETTTPFPSLASHNKNTTALAISKTMLLFDMKPDTWRKLQFQHIGFFRDIDCPKCLVTFCLQCGQREHPNVTCEESMQKVVDNNNGPMEFIETVRWELKNSRRCPNCSIMINRDEGCNKVDCSLCGFCFCWACRSPWSEKCGFYHCAEAKAEQISTNSPELSEAKTELGVPNVSSIQARLFPIT